MNASRRLPDSSWVVSSKTSGRGILAYPAPSKTSTAKQAGLTIGGPHFVEAFVELWQQGRIAPTGLNQDDRFTWEAVETASSWTLRGSYEALKPLFML